MAWKKKERIASPVTKHDRAYIDPNDETTATPVLEKHEFQAVVAAAETVRQALVVVLIYTLAGRVTECCEAQLSHLRQQGEKKKLNLRRKGDKRRSWEVPSDLWRLAQLATAGRSSGPLLVDDDGNPMDRHAVDRLLTRLGKLAGVLSGRDLTPHVLRASRLTHMHDDGVPMEEIQEYADHSSIETTRRYIRLREKSKRRAQHARDAASVYGHLVSRFTEVGDQGEEAAQGD
ncbi:site-specific integrase [Streptomyces sp. NEAU-Y11]|nr:site-specific integrase [Streptomyces sp. NEAU-Y11]